MKLIDRVNGSATRLPRQCDLSVESRLLPDKLYFESLVRGTLPFTGQISVGASAHLRRLPTAGNGVKLIDRVNGSATRLPRQCDLSVESRLLPDKLYFESLVRGTLPFTGQISVGASAHLRGLTTAGNSLKLIDRVNGSVTRLPRQCDLSVETRLLPDKLLILNHLSVEPYLLPDKFQ